MAEDEVEELEREARLIRAWIRQVTAKKQARLRAIGARLVALSAKTGKGAKGRDSA